MLYSLDCNSLQNVNVPNSVYGLYGLKHDPIFKNKHHNDMCWKEIGLRVQFY
jgi:hypothetical protein